MFCKVISGGVHGIDSFQACVEVDVSQSMPGFEMVGLLNSEVKEAKERVRVALKNAKFRIPPLRITVNISPADVRKEGSAFDLAIAVGILAATEQLSENVLEDTLFIGELGLNGEIKPVKGILPIMMMAKERGIGRCILPKENALEGAVIQGVEVIGVTDLSELFTYLSQENTILSPTIFDPTILFQEEWQSKVPDFEDIRGQEMVKRAAVIGAAGFHHLHIVRHVLFAGLGHEVARIERTRILVSLVIVGLGGKSPRSLRKDFAQHFQVHVVADGEIVSPVAQIETTVHFIPESRHDEPR